jgi:hypothetical protein
MTFAVSRRLYAVIVVGAAALVAVLGAGLVFFGTAAHDTRPPDAVARQVGAHYGDSHPRILALTSTTTDNPPHDPMYFMTLGGRFRYGHRRARFVQFSALADQAYVWGLIGYTTDARAPLWWEADLGPLPR